MLAGRLVVVVLLWIYLAAAVDATQDAKQRELIVVPTTGGNKQQTKQPGLVAKGIQNNDLEDEYSAEHALYGHLLGRTYQKHVRPVKDHHRPITVKVGMCVMMIEDIIERDQIMVMASCVKMIWTDDFLAWDPQRFGNITWMAISSEKIWLPDIAIVNSPEPHSLTRKVTNVDLTFDGGVGYFPSGRLITRCNVIISYFPFDRQNCEVRFESWIYPSQYLEIELYPGEEAVDIKEYYVNLHWTILGYKALPERVDYDGKNFSCITFVFSLRRKSAFYFMYFIFPELMLALLQTLSHTLPVEHPGRMTMLTALFIGASVTHSGIAAHIPKSSDSMSLLQIYMAIVSVNLVFALINSFVMLYTVLRYPNKEPTIFAMLVSFFSIIWPEKPPRHYSESGSRCFRRKKSRRSQDDSGAFSNEQNEMPSSSNQQQPLLLGDGKNAGIPAASAHAHRQTELALSPSGDSMNGNGIHASGASPITYSEVYSPSILQPRSWLLDPKNHSPNCRSDYRDPSPVRHGNSGHAKRRAVTNNNNSEQLSDIFFSTVLLNDPIRSPAPAKHHSSQHHSRSAQHQPSPSQHHESLNRKMSSYGGGSSTQYMSKAYCLQQCSHAPLNKNDILAEDDSNNPEDENACSLVTPRSVKRLPAIFVEDDKKTLALAMRNFKGGNTSSSGATVGRKESEIWHRQEDQGQQEQGSARKINFTGSDNEEPNTSRNRKASEASERHRRLSGRRQSSKDSDQYTHADYKHRWLVYCVALDKSIMYINGVWNLIIPLTLFVILPWLNDILSMDNIS